VENRSAIIRKRAPNELLAGVLWDANRQEINIERRVEYGVRSHYDHIGEFGGEGNGESQLELMFGVLLNIDNDKT
jgi:hypothetical protein